MLEQEIKKAASLTSEAEPKASEAEPVATPVVRMEQLYSFVCPISQDVMVDPVILVENAEMREMLKE